MTARKYKAVKIQYTKKVNKEKRVLGGGWGVEAISRARNADKWVKKRGHHVLYDLTLSKVNQCRRAGAGACNPALALTAAGVSGRFVRTPFRQFFKIKSLSVLVKCIFLARPRPGSLRAMHRWVLPPILNN